MAIPEERRKKLPAIGAVLQATPGYWFFLQARLAWRSHRLELSSLPQKEESVPRSSVPRLALQDELSRTGLRQVGTRKLL